MSSKSSLRSRIMMTSSNGNILRVTGHLCGEFTGERRIPLTKASDADVWYFLWSAPNKGLSKQSRRRWFEIPPCTLWRHCNVCCFRAVRDIVLPWIGLYWKSIVARRLSGRNVCFIFRVIFNNLLIPNDRNGRVCVPLLHRIPPVHSLYEISLYFHDHYSIHIWQFFFQIIFATMIKMPDLRFGVTKICTLQSLRVIGLLMTSSWIVYSRFESMRVTNVKACLPSLYYWFTYLWGIRAACFAICNSLWPSEAMGQHGRNI